MPRHHDTRLLSVRLSAAAAARVARLAKARHTTVSAVIREALEALGEPSSLWDRVKPLIGKKGSGVGDLSSNKQRLKDFGA